MVLIFSVSLTHLKYYYKYTNQWYYIDTVKWNVQTLK